MGKIGILTFQASNNYGALLQAYALQRTLLKEKKDVTILNYISPTKVGWYKPLDFSIKKGVKHNLKQIFKIPNSYFVITKNKKTDCFKQKYLKISEQKFVGKSEGLEKHLAEYDTIFVGSDQVWNYTNTSFDKVYFLDFTNTSFNKVSYAASFGMESLPAEIVGEYKRLLSSFDKLSVREKSGLKIVNKIVGNNKAEVSLDPTLLLSKEEWINDFPCILEKLCADKYLLVYMIGRDKNLDALATYISKEYNLKIIRVKRDFRDSFSKIHSKNPSVTEFLSLIYNADYVLTNSFHGVAFSVNFGKEFFVYLNPKNSANTRINNLLSIVDMQDRVIHLSNQINSSKDINYQLVNSLLVEPRMKSKSYINNIVK